MTRHDRISAGGLERKASTSFFEKKGCPPGEAKKLSLTAGCGCEGANTHSNRKFFCFFFFKKRSAFFLLTLALATPGCTTYQPAPLSLTPPQQTSAAALDPGGAPLPASRIAALALLNDPDLVAARARHRVAAADRLTASLLPDPTLSAGFEALVAGPADAPAVSGGLAQDISALVTYRVTQRAAQAGAAQVDAEILWQEWQVAAQAVQLCINLAGDQALLASLRQDRAALAAVNAATANAVAAADQTVTAASSSLAALAATDTALDSAAQQAALDTDALDALLNLPPGTALPLAPVEIAPLDPAVARAAIVTLPERRPDLIALRYGYQQADARLRAAILAQFLPISLGPSAGRDTSKVVGFGPQISLTLPLFNRNRGAIAAAGATRALLAAQFQASLAAAEGGAASLLGRIELLSRQCAEAQARARAAARTEQSAQAAFAAGELDAASAATLAAAAGERSREALALNGQLQTARLSLITLLGLGLPPLAPAAAP